MPYIKKESRRGIFDPEYRTVSNSFITSPGELNFAITSLIIEYVKNQGKNYQTINDIVGALECAKLEFQRRVINKYEDSKIEENGDVYPVVL